MISPARIHSRRKKARKGQALVEFALIAPVMVTLLLFCIYFYELNFIKIKTQEMARFAAWEMTGFPLHDYGKESQDQYFRDAKSEIESEMDRRYANLLSTDTKTDNKLLALSWEKPTVRLRDQQEPQIPTGNMMIDLNTILTVVGYIIDIWSGLSFTHGNLYLMGMMGIYLVEKNLVVGARGDRFNPPRKWGLNRNGYIQVQVRTRFRNEWIPKKFLQHGRTGWFTNKHFMATRFTLQETSALVADSWRLHEGDSVTPSDNKQFSKVVDRMVLVSNTVRNVVKPFVIAFKVVVNAMEAVANVAAPGFRIMQVDPLKGVVASKAYKERRNDSGQISIEEDDNTRKYDTTPNKEGSEYRKAFTNRGDYFMGCHEKERLTCGASLSQENPFGDYVVPPPENN